MSYRLTVGGPAGGELVARPAETVLAAAARHHWRVAAGCRNGNCLTCRAELLAGRVRNLQGLDLEPGPLLTCQAVPLSDVQLAWPAAAAPGSASAARDFSCRLLASDPWGNAWRSRLELPAGRLPTLLAGQWLVANAHGLSRRLWVTARSAGGARRELLVLSDMALAEPRPLLQGPFGAIWQDGDTPAPLHVLVGAGRALQAQALRTVRVAQGPACSRTAPGIVLALSDDPVQRSRWRAQWQARNVLYVDDDIPDVAVAGPVEDAGPAYPGNEGRTK